jgi:Helix-turn-helix of DDE superfamily endonuclease
MELTGQSLRIARSKSFERLSGLNVEKFKGLIEAMTPAIEAAEKKRLSTRERKRNVGAGNSYKLDICDQILLTLMYYRTYITQEFAGFMFGLDDSNVSRCVCRIGRLMAGHFRLPEKRLMDLDKDTVATLFLMVRNNPSNGHSAKSHVVPAIPVRKNGTR